MRPRPLLQGPRPSSLPLLPAQSGFDLRALWIAKEKKKESYRTTKAHGANVKYKHGVGL